MTSIQAATQLEEGRSSTSLLGKRQTHHYQGGGNPLHGYRGDFSPATNSSESIAVDNSRSVSVSNENIASLPRGEETIPLVDCIQVAFSQSNRHHLFIVYPKEVCTLRVHLDLVEECVCVSL